MKKMISIQSILIAIVVILFTGGILTSQAEQHKISFNKTKLTLCVGEKEKLKVRGTSSKVKWSSSDRKVAAVSQKGLVSAKKTGKAVIQAKIGGQILRARVVVTMQF